ncbi:MAG: ankyrin repeat domain-containing protein [Bacteroidota bacterium]
MTVHSTHQIASVFKECYQHYVSSLELEFEDAALPALRKSLRNLSFPDRQIISGHIIFEGKTLPFVDMIICNDHVEYSEWEQGWGVVDCKYVLGVVCRHMDDYESEAFSEFQEKAFSATDKLGLYILSELNENTGKEALTALSSKVIASQVGDKLNGKKSYTNSAGLNIPNKTPLKEEVVISKKAEQVKGPDLGPMDPSTGNYAIHKAIVANEGKAISQYLGDGGQTEIKNKKGNTLLHLAVMHGHVDIIEMLLAHGADPNSRNYIYETALHLAVKLDKLACQDVLLEHGAEVEVRNNRANTPLHLAAMYGREDAAASLLDHGADIHAQMEKDMLPLHVSAWYGQAGIAKQLIDLGANVNAQNIDGNTALHFAAFKGKVKVIKVLMRAGADPTIKNKDEKIYLEGVNEGYDGEMIRILD